MPMGLGAGFAMARTTAREKRAKRVVCMVDGGVEFVGGFFVKVEMAVVIGDVGVCVCC